MYADRQARTRATYIKSPRAIILYVSILHSTVACTANHECTRKSNANLSAKMCSFVLPLFPGWINVCIRSRHFERLHVSLRWSASPQLVALAASCTETHISKHVFPQRLSHGGWSLETKWPVAPEISIIEALFNDVWMHQCLENSVITENSASISHLVTDFWWEHLNFLSILVVTWAAH